MSLTSRRGDVPISVEGVRKNIQRSIHAVERETEQFISEYSNNVGSPETWLDFVATACSRSGKDPGTLSDFKDLRPILTRVRDHEEMNEYRDEYVELRRMVERGKAFENIAFSVRNDLAKVYETQLERFCLSFYQETKEERLKSIQEYEETIRVCRREVKDRMALVDRLLDEADKFKESLMQYLENYHFVVNRMVDACQAVAGVCIPMKKWLAADAGYTQKIQEEITSYTRRKLDLQDVIKEKDAEREMCAKRVRKAQTKTLTLQKKLTKLKEDKRFYKRRKADVEERYIKCDAELQRQRNDLHEVREKVRNRDENTPAMQNYLTGMSEAIRNELRLTDEKLVQMGSQMEGLDRDEARVQREIDRLSGEAEEIERNRTAALERVRKCDDELKFVNDDIRLHADKILALKKVREVKLHSDTLKKIYHYGYKPELILEGKDELYEALRVTAEDIGKDWTTLYQRLPFDPQRDSRERQRDLEVIDLTHHRLDVGYKVLALKSLEKWRRMSNLATLDELLNTLKKMKKEETIERIRREVFTKSATY